MKTTGRTNDGNYIVEITELEYATFGKLCMALEGKTIDEVMFMHNPAYIMHDFSDTFGAIYAWTVAQFRINEMRQLVDSLQRSIDEHSEAK